MADNSIYFKKYELSLNMEKFKKPPRKCFIAASVA